MTCLVDCGPQLGWSEWGPCSVSCGGGIRTRTNFFQPDFNICTGKTVDKEPCNEESCTSAAGLIIGSALGFCLVIAALVIVAILVKRRMAKQNKELEMNEPSESGNPDYYAPYTDNYYDSIK